MDKQGNATKAAKGEGYTVRIDGKKVVRTKVLESQVEEALSQYRDLLQQNEALRAKEAEQLRLLGLYEAWSRSVKTSTSDSGPANSNDSSSCLPAPSRLERKSKKLLESIRPLATPQPAADVQDTATGPARSGQGVTALRHPEPAAQGSGSGNDTVAATTFQHGHMVGNGTAAAPSPAYEAGEEASSADAHMTRWFNCIKPEDLDYFRTNTAEELAMRIRSIVGQVAEVHLQAGPNKNVARVWELLDEIGQVCAMQVMANEKVLCKLYEMNMETLQVEPFPADLWLRVLHAANLTPKQRQTIIETYEKFSQGTAQLLQQQHTLMQELQATMGVGAIQHSSAAAGAAAVSANVRPAGAAHFMSLATGGPVPLSEADATASAAAGAHAGANGSQHACAAPDAVMRSPLRWDNTGTPLSPDEMQFLTEWLSDCKEQSSSALEASRNSNSWLAPAGVLPLVSAEKADALMQQLSRIAGGVKQHLHQLTIMFVNLLETEQRADVVLACYPFMMDLPQFCACVAAEEAKAKTKPAGRSKTPNRRRS